MKFNYFKTSMMSIMAVGALAFSTSMSAAGWKSIITGGSAADGQTPSIQAGWSGPAAIVADPAGAGEVFECPIAADPEYAWSSQLFIVFNEPLQEGDVYKVAFDYYCSDARTIDMQAHGNPGGYHHYSIGINALDAKAEWQSVNSGPIEVTSEMAGEDGFKSIAFNLSSAPEAATFYINNVVVQMEGVFPSSVEPAEGKVETLENFTLVFEEGAEVAWTVSGTENAPYVTRNGNTLFTAGSPAALTIDGSNLTFHTDEFCKKGEYKLIVPAGSYSVNGEPGKACEYTWDVEGILLGLDVDPAVSAVNQIQTIRITFQDNDKVVLTEDWGTEHGAYLYKETEAGLERRGTFMPEVVGTNNLLLTMRSPITEPGDYVVEVDAACLIVDDELYNEPITLNFTISEPEYPEIDLSVNPATNIVETLDVVELTFGGIEFVEWAATGTENAPYLEDLDGNRAATFTRLGDYKQGQVATNVLTLALYNEEFALPGDYKLVIPAGSYKLGGDYYGMDGKEIELSFTVLGLGGITVEPSVNVLSEIQNFKIIFNEAKEVTLSEALGTDNTPYIDFFNQDGVRERRGTLFPSVFGNTMILTMNTPLTDEGDYVVVIPGTVYFLDGNEGSDIELSYSVVPDITAKYTVEPAEGTVTDLHTVAITFEETEVAFWNVKEINADPSIAPTVALNGEDLSAGLSLYSNGNVISAAVDQANTLTEAGYYVFNIPAASYFVEGWNSVDIILAYILDPAASDDPTAVNAIFGGKTNMTVYDINGRIVLRNAAPAEVMGLRGIYVIDGKKYILR